MGSPLVIRDAPAAAVIGGGFIGAGPRRGACGGSASRSSDCSARRPSGPRGPARRLGIPRVYRDLDDLLADGRVGVVHIASPNAEHFEQARRSLESGRHVVCEKPLATTSDETSALRDLAASRPSQAAAVNYNIRYYPLCREVRDRIAAGSIGRVLSITGSYVQDWLLYPDDYNWRVEADGRTNLRAVADIGTHWMDLAQYLIGLPIRSVIADLATFHPRRLKPTGPTDTFTGSSGGGSNRPSPRGRRHDRRPCRGPPAVRVGRPRRLPRLAGDRRPKEPPDDSRSPAPRARSPGTASRPTASGSAPRRTPSSLLPRDPALLGPSAAAMAHYPGGHVEGFPDTFKQLYVDVYAWIADGRRCRPPPGFPTFADGDREVRLCEAIARSAAVGRWAP